MTLSQFQKADCRVSLGAERVDVPSPKCYPRFSRQESEARRLRVLLIKSTQRRRLTIAAQITLYGWYATNFQREHVQVVGPFRKQLGLVHVRM